MPDHSHWQVSDTVLLHHMHPYPENGQSFQCPDRAHGSAWSHRTEKNVHLTPFPSAVSGFPHNSTYRWHTGRFGQGTVRPDLPENTFPQIQDWDRRCSADRHCWNKDARRWSDNRWT